MSKFSTQQLITSAEHPVDEPASVDATDGEENRPWYPIVARVHDIDEGICPMCDTQIRRSSDRLVEFERRSNYVRIVETELPDGMMEPTYEVQQVANASEWICDKGHTLEDMRVYLNDQPDEWEGF